MWKKAGAAAAFLDNGGDDPTEPLLAAEVAAGASRRAAAPSFPVAVVERDGTDAGDNPTLFKSLGNVRYWLVWWCFTVNTSTALMISNNLAQIEISLRGGVQPETSQ